MMWAAVCRACAHLGIDHILSSSFYQAKGTSEEGGAGGSVEQRKGLAHGKEQAGSDTGNTVVQVSMRFPNL
jgi:hypothetical protein